MQTATVDVMATAENLVELLGSVKGAKIVTITTKTQPSFQRTDDKSNPNPFCGKTVKDHDVWKISRVNGIVNWDYAKSVNRQLDREGQEADFEAKPRKWGTRLSGLPFVVHVGKDGKVQLYLEMKVERSLDYHYEDGFGNEIPKEKVSPFLRKSGPSRQGTDNEIILRDYRMDGILAIRYQGTTYVVEGNLKLVSDIAAIRA